jgi:hypothetical protein
MHTVNTLKDYMSTIQKFNNFKDYQKALRKDLKAYKKRLSKAIIKTVKESTKVIKKNAPTRGGNAVARVKSNIKEKTKVKQLKIICERPYSMYIEIGTAPNEVDVAPLLAWCEEKGIPENIAWKIRNSIKKRGIKPTFFMAKSLPEINIILDKNIKIASRGEANDSPIIEVEVIEESDLGDLGDS